MSHFGAKTLAQLRRNGADRRHDGAGMMTRAGRAGESIFEMRPLAWAIAIGHPDFYFDDMAIDGAFVAETHDAR